MKNWICAQIGAREHYAVPRVLQRLGMLEHFYTDFWAGTMLQTLGALSGRSILRTRFHNDLEKAKVTSFNATTVLDSVFGDVLKKNPYDWFHYVGKDFGERIVGSLQRQKKINWKEIIFFGYDTGFFEPAQWINQRGGKTIVCQMDPSRFEVDLVREEGKRWPGFVKKALDVPESYFQRREAEWAVANLVMVNSEWTRQALIRQGVKNDKIVVIPLAFEASCHRHTDATSSRPSNFDSRRKLRVLFLGQVILRKGIQYLIEAARLLSEERIHFDVVGSIGIFDEAVNSAPANMTFHGPVSRDRTEAFYRSADLFILPTLSDGFALTQLEAMAHGLPVIATPNCGDVVTDGVDGLIVPPSDPNALAEAFQLILQDPEKLRSMREATDAKLEQFSLARLGENLAALEQRLL
jgi:glycosyltransferase involved in cell wall biosynthesis